MSESIDTIIALQKKKATELSAKIRDDDSRFFNIRKNKDGEITGKTLKVRVVADYLVKRCNILVSDYHNVLYYDERYGIYRGGFNEIDILLVSLFGSYITIRINNEIQKQILKTSDIQITKEDTDEMFTHRNLLCFKNGVYDRRSKTIVPHDPKYHFLSQIPVDYDSNAKCKDIEEYLKVTFTDCDDEMEWLGYILTSDNWMERMSFYVGQGATGKSTYFNLIGRFFGSEFISSATPHQLADNNGYYLANLLGKTLCISGDIGSSKIKQFHVLKMLTGNDFIEARVAYGHPFRFQNKSKIMYSMNETPIIDDKTDGASRRLRIVKMDNKHDNTNRFIINDLIKPENLSALLNLALAGLDRLIKRGDFKTKIDIDEYELMSKPIYGFMDECILITQSNKDYIYSDDLYDIYVKWTKLRNLNLLPQKTFINKLKNSYLKELKYTRIKKKGFKIQYGFRGIVPGELICDNNWNDPLMKNDETIQKEGCGFDCDKLGF